MASKMPDEMLHEFLSPVLSVLDVDFASTSSVSPFSSISRNSSATMLLVCKRWLRVAYPLLYHTVVIRSSGQARALSDSLKANPMLGKHVKKLRLEGGYGAATHTILTSCPNITDLYMSLIIWSDDSVSGLCRSLSAINPSRVILHDDEFNPKINAKTRQLVLKLCECITAWSNLVEFDFPYFDYSGNSAIQKRSELIAEALKKAPNLGTVSGLPGYRFPDNLSTMSLNPSLKTIWLRCLPDGLDAEFQEALKLEANAKVRALIRFDEVLVEEPKQEEPPIIPRHFISPLDRASHAVQEHIWNEIVAFSLRVDPATIHTPFTKIPILGWRVGLLFVSKMFYKLAVPHFYGQPVIFTSKGVSLFSDRLAEDASLGLRLRCLYHLYRRNIFDSRRCYPDAHNKALMNIVSQAPQLTRFHGMPFYSFGLSWEAFCCMVDTAGDSLLEFEHMPIYNAPEFCTAQPFRSLVALRSLMWDCLGQFSGTDVKGYFPHLMSLTISRCDPSFLKLVSNIDLPILSRFADTTSRDPKALEELEALIKKHGHKFRELELPCCPSLNTLDMCPALNVLTFSMRNWHNEPIVLHCRQKHLSLTKVVICHGPIKDEVYDKFFSSLNLANFPALREIRTERCFWTTDEREISKNPWVRRSEALLRSDVMLMDKNGIPWRPRLKRSKR